MVHAHPAPEVRAEVRTAGLCLAPFTPDLEVRETAAVYHPRSPAESVLYAVVAGHLETFLDRQHRRDRCVPRFVERELRSFLECGVLARG
jgi:hypothetical protein